MVKKGARDQTMYWLFKQVPLAVVLIIAVLILLFGDYRKPTIVLCCIPLLAVGIVGAMLLTGKTFDFCAIVGALGLMGMLIKNCIVLLDEIGQRCSGDTDLIAGLVVSAQSRLRPVMMASLTTILGMIPLLGDAMFGSMAATIMGGLFFSTIATLLFLPILYALFFKNQNEIIRFGRRPYLTVRAAPMRRERCRYSTSASNNCNTMFARSSAQGRTTGANGPGFHYL